MKQTQQNCRDCGRPYGDHRAFCAQMPAEPAPDRWTVPENDPADLAAVDDKVVAQATGERREVR